MTGVSWLAVEHRTPPQRRFVSRASPPLARLLKKPVLAIDGTSGEIFGGLAAVLRKGGSEHRHRIQDLWLASQAIQHSLFLLTHNRKDFIDVPGLRLAVWEDVFQG